MNVKELIEWLGNFPPDAEVVTVVVEPGGQYTQGGEAYVRDFNVGDPVCDDAGPTDSRMNATWDYTDIKPCSYFPDGLKRLQIGEIK